ncbi:hypothetical protein H5410_056046 [Solanum commersonii]|uniref:Uncharacterized protein n=1 Tax=Solanum commersonii TaxID=4109 RepID=A0A9J5WLJ9_SOLCO|nr:hypothetical protein H5410_056046 [Solanum commersonii]
MREGALMYGCHRHCFVHAQYIMRRQSSHASAGCGCGSVMKRTIVNVLPLASTQCCDSFDSSNHPQAQLIQACRNQT